MCRNIKITFKNLVNFRKIEVNFFKTLEFIIFAIRKKLKVKSFVDLVKRV